MAKLWHCRCRATSRNTANARIRTDVSVVSASIFIRHESLILSFIVWGICCVCAHSTHAEPNNCHLNDDYYLNNADVMMIRNGVCVYGLCASLVDFHFQPPANKSKKTQQNVLWNILDRIELVFVVEIGYMVSVATDRDAHENDDK